MRRSQMTVATYALLLSACTGTFDAGPVGPGSERCDAAQCGKVLPDGGVLAPTTSGRGVGDPSTPNGVGWSTRFPKLTNQQWENTVQDLFGLDAPTGLSSAFVPEAANKGYTSVAAATVTISGTAWAAYQTAAESVAQRILGDDTLYGKLMPQGTFSDDTARAQSLIAALGRRAYRRPLTDAEKQAFSALFAQGPTLVGGDAFKAGVQLVIEAMLQSPHFLYRVESSDSGATDEGKVFLSGYELATRLSYALWDSMPSDELLDAAANGGLDSKDGVASWAQRLLDDARARDTLLSFHEQTFIVSAYGTQDKDPSLHFDVAATAPVMREEARRFFEQVILDERGGIAQLLTEPVAYVNELTAPYYGLSGVSGTDLVRKDLDPSQRAGLFTQLGFLTKNATRAGSDPVHRGLTILRKVLCDEPDPPPMMFSLPAPEAGLTTRELYEKATACGVGCHDTLINPPGFAFENFDALGQLRTTDQGKPVDTAATLTVRSGYTSAEKHANPTQKLSFTGAVDLAGKLAKEGRVHECYARNWMEFVLGRELDPVEQGAWEALRDASQKQGSARALLLALVQLDTFRSRVAEGP